MPTRPVNNREPVEEEKLFECYDCNEEYSSGDMCSHPMYSDDEDIQICINCECEYSFCADCGIADYAGDLRYSDYAEEYYCNDCYSDRHQVDLEGYEHTSEACFSTYGDNTFANNKFSRFVGIEIETIYPVEDDMDSDIPDFYPDKFKNSYDGSIETSGEGRGVEFISEPMNGDILFNNIDTMGRYLRTCNFYINKTCGFHVHIDARDLYYKELKGIMLVTKSFEKTIKNMMPDSRQQSSWCKDLVASKYEIRSITSDTEFIDKWYDWASEEPSMDKYNASRYYGLNLHARVYHGTIEFRYHSATNNSTKIKNWITICQSIVQQGIKLGKELPDVVTQSEITNVKNRELAFSNHDLGIEKFIEYLDLKDMRNYIVRRVNKFRHDLSSADYTYIGRNI